MKHTAAARFAIASYVVAREGSLPVNNLSTRCRKMTTREPRGFAIIVTTNIADSRSTTGRHPMDDLSTCISQPRSMTKVDSSHELRDMRTLCVDNRDAKHYCCC